MSFILTLVRAQLISSWTLTSLSALWQQLVSPIHSTAKTPMDSLLFPPPPFFLQHLSVCCCWMQCGVLHSLFGGAQGDRPYLRASRKLLLCFGILLSVRSGCMLTDVRGITPQLSCTHKRAWSRGWPPGHRTQASMSVRVCECKWFILKQDIRVLRIHPYHKLGNSVLHCSMRYILPVLPCQSVTCVRGEIVCAYILCMCLCV